ncbi:membrane protease subunit [Caballeronia zhejiangensis]|uniref:membrane protease subunit n=1 Tax=Caballeronia zhejiangensis TaxID=871203 RepID=UPI00158E30C9|nr:membrane protease subunit [Caballeronia zhejiangensis]
MKRNILLAAVLGATVILTGCDMYPPYRVYSQKMEGEAELAKANYSKQVQIQDALAKKESAKALADAEVIRAEGVAKANAIIGDSLKGNDAYLRYLWINKLADSEDKHGQVIYVPTEAGLPILEANRLQQAK